MLEPSFIHHPSIYQNTNPRADIPNHESKIFIQNREVSGRQPIQTRNHDIIRLISSKCHCMRRDVEGVTGVCDEFCHAGRKSDEINNTTNRNAVNC